MTRERSKLETLLLRQADLLRADIAREQARADKAEKSIAAVKEAARANLERVKADQAKAVKAKAALVKADQAKGAAARVLALTADCAKLEEGLEAYAGEVVRLEAEADQLRRRLLVQYERTEELRSAKASIPGDRVDAMLTLHGFLQDTLPAGSESLADTMAQPLLLRLLPWIEAGPSIDLPHVEPLLPIRDRRRPRSEAA